MKGQGMLTNLGPFLTLMQSTKSGKKTYDEAHRTEREGSGSAEVRTLPEAVIRSVSGAAEAKSSQPAMVILGPVLLLLMMLRNRRPRRDRIRWPEFRLPRGCVLGVRYSSR